MKKVVILVILGITVIGCKIHETIAINELNEVNLRYGFDFSPMLKIGNKNNEGKKVEEKTKKVIDTVLDFKTLLVERMDSVAMLPDSIKAQLELLSLFDIRMKVDESKDIFLYEMGINVGSINDISKDMNPFKSISALSKTDKSLAMGASKAGSDNENYETTYTYNDKVFIKTITSKNKKREKVKKPSENEELGDDEFSKQIKEALKECSYVMKYSFPKKIKSVSLKGAKISEDKKTFTYEVLLDEMENQENLSFKVEFQ